MWGFFIVRGLSRGESSSWALFKNKNTKGSVGGDLQVLTDFSPSLQPECWKSPESGIKKKSGGKMFRYRACAQSLRGMPGSEGRCRWSSLKERINLSTWTRRKYGRHSGLPLPLQPLNEICLLPQPWVEMVIYVFYGGNLMKMFEAVLGLMCISIS